MSAQLDTTAELEEGGDSAPASTQSLSGSPPHESKMRQISQGVEDLTWQNMPKQSTPELDDQPQPEAEQDQDSSAVEGQHEPMDAENVSDNQQESDDGQQEAQGETVIPPSLRGENPPLIVDNDGADEHAGEADPAAAPPVAQPEEPSTPPPRSTSPMLTSPQRNVPSASASTSRRGSDSSMDQEKGLKRKLADRTTTEHQTLAENGITLATKRPRDDPDKDENPREPKRPTPPPDGSEANSKKTEASPPVQKPAPTTPQLVSYESSRAHANAHPSQGGFMAYASANSPFASVKGPSLFSSKPAPWAGIASASTSTPAKPASPSPVLGTPLFANSLAATTLASSPPKEQSLKRTGFEAFASSSSPFASAAKRPKSPPPMQASLFGHRSKSPARHHSPARVNAFSAYASTAHAFSGSTHRRSGSGSPALSNAEPASLPLASENGNNNNESQDDSGSEKGVSFGDRLRASKDDGEDEDETAEKKLNLTEQEGEAYVASHSGWRADFVAVHTGEEDELTVYQVRGKLFTLSDQQQWKERGTGQLKLNVRRDDGGGARLRKCRCIPRFDTATDNAS